MKELLYFSSSDVMIQVSYSSEKNSLDYYSHRKLTFGERVIVEQYLLNNIAVKTEYYKRVPSVLNYYGVDSRLVKDLNQFHLKSTINVLKDKEKEVESSVRNLIDKSMANYYFEQIGSTIIEIRTLLEDQSDELQLQTYRVKLQELIKAYNSHASKKVSFREILPKELQAYF